MSFARIWTAALAGSVVAVPVSLGIAAVAALFPVIAGFGREGLTPVFLIAWGIASILCAAGRSQIWQWLSAMWMGVASLCITAVFLAAMAQGFAIAGALILTAAIIGWTSIALHPR